VGERGRSGDNDARALFLSSAAGERVELLWIRSDRFEFWPPAQFDYAKFRSRSQKAVIRVYDEVGNVIETHEHAGDFKRVVSSLFVALFASVVKVHEGRPCIRPFIACFAIKESGLPRVRTAHK